MNFPLPRCQCPINRGFSLDGTNLFYTRRKYNGHGRARSASGVLVALCCTFSPPRERSLFIAWLKATVPPRPYLLAPSSWVLVVEPFPSRRSTPPMLCYYFRSVPSVCDFEAKHIRSWSTHTHIHSYTCVEKRRQSAGNYILSPVLSLHHCPVADLCHIVERWNGATLPYWSLVEGIASRLIVVKEEVGDKRSLSVRMGKLLICGCLEHVCVWVSDTESSRRSVKVTRNFLDYWFKQRAFLSKARIFHR